MQAKLPILITIFFASLLMAKAQQFGAVKIIDSTLSNGEDIYPGDFDGDNDIDLAVAFVGGDSIIWYENDGTGKFNTTHFVTKNLDRVRAVYAADLNQDGKTDLISASQLDKRIAWYENDGTGTNWTAHNLTVNANYALDVSVNDLDGDKLIDIAYAASAANRIGWFKNLGSGNFSGEKIITNSAMAVLSISTVDLDKDNDMDIVSATWGDSIAWYKNDGNGKFGSIQFVSDQVLNARGAYGADLDGDAWPDIISASNDDDKVAWYKNDGNGGFGAQQIIDTLLDYAMTAIPYDIDLDNDQDLFAAGYGTKGEIAWYENNGSGQFTKHSLHSKMRYRGNELADVDGDGDLDIVALTSGILVWFENLSKLSTSAPFIAMRKFYPNPMNDKAIVSFEKEIFIEKIEIYNLLGKTLRRISLYESRQELLIEKGDLIKGCYFLKIYGSKEVQIIKFLVN